jgi:hypothetical protein
VISRRKRVLDALATPAGHAVRLIGRGGPGVLGPTLVALGVALVYVPAGLIAAGAILWLWDWRRP